MTDLSALIERVEKASERMAGAASEIYSEPNERAALRCALGDAAGLCDALAKEIIKDHATKSGYIKNKGRELAGVATACGNAIWKMRENITADHTLRALKEAE